MLIPAAVTTAPMRIPSPCGQGAVAVALQLDEAVADQPAGQPGDQMATKAAARAAGRAAPTSAVRRDDPRARG